MKNYKCYVCLQETWNDGYKFITEENKSVWQRYLDKLVARHLNAETMETEEFKAAERDVIEEHRRWLEYEKRAEAAREADRYRRSAMEKPRIDFIPQGLEVDYEAEYARFFEQEVTFVPRDNDDFMYLMRFMERWQKKSISQILAKGRPDVAYAIAIGLCRYLPLLLNRDDIVEYTTRYKTRLGKLVLASYASLVETVTAWNNEEKRQEVCRFRADNAGQHTSPRGLAKKLMDLMPVTPFVGKPVDVFRGIV